MTYTPLPDEETPFSQLLPSPAPLPGLQLLQPVHGTTQPELPPSFLEMQLCEPAAQVKDAAFW